MWIAPRLRAADSGSPSEKLNVACIGVGGRGHEDLKGVAGENIVALVDVDGNTLGKAAAEFPKARTFKDYRRMLDAVGKEIDAVVVGTPDHTHAPATLAALRAGKHVYCEKPLTHTVAEARLVAQTTAKHKRVTQMGTQVHAQSNYRRVVELLQAGAIGTVRRVHTWVNTSYHGGDRPKDTPAAPEGLDWDLWIGPAPMRPYHKAYHPFWWRGWWDFGGGALADMACHHMDLPHWALGLRHPVTVAAQGPEDHPEASPRWLIVDYEYAARPGDIAHGGGPGVHLTWYHGGKRPPEFENGTIPEAHRNWGGGNLFIGDEGMLLADYGKHVLLPQEKFSDYKRPAATIPDSIGHHREWVEACKADAFGQTTCNFDYSGALTETVLLGNVAYRIGKKLEWDALKLKATNAAEADAFVTKAYRKGWEL